MGIWYTTREDVKSALDIKETARNNGAVDKAIEAASRSVEGLLHRKFYPMKDTRYFDWPNLAHARGYRLWLDEHEVIAVTQLVSGGVTLTTDEYFLEPANDPPYASVELNLGASGFFETDDTWQRSIAITGTFAGCSTETTPIGTIVEALDATETGVDTSNSATWGIGDILQIDTEWMVVTGRTQLDTGQNTANALLAKQSDNIVSVASGAALNVDEVILVDAEKMRIVDIAANNLIVERAVDGSVLTTHDMGKDVYAPRTATVQRGSLGSTAASHTTSTASTRILIPGLVSELAVAYALNNLLQRSSGYARVAGEGDNAREFTGRGITAIEKDAKTRYGRQLRVMAV